MAGRPTAVRGRPSPAHAAAALGVAVVLALSAFASWASLTTRAASDEIRRASQLTDAYADARDAVARAELLARQYRLTPSHELEGRFPAAGAAVERSLRVVREIGNEDDRALAGRVLTQNRENQENLARVVAAVQAGDVRRVERLDETRVHPAFARMSAAVNAAAAGHRAASTAQLAASHRAETATLVATLVSGSLTLLLLAAVAVAVRLRRRLDAARQAELRRLADAAFSDHLTGLGNHRAFHRALKTAEGEPLALVLLDLDGLKRTNDTEGHGAGDELIVGLADALRTAGLGGRAYRIGGDEFAVAIPGGSAADGLAAAAVLRGQLARRRGRHVSVTAGVAGVVGAETRETLVRHADTALIAAKRLRRGVLVYEPGLETAAQPVPRIDPRASGTLATALAGAVDVKHGPTQDHCETVAELSALIAQELGLEPVRVDKVRLAGLLHDVGKIGIPDSILRKPGPLTDDEWKVMRTHSLLGHHIVSAAELHDEAEWILHHHERLDGRGYPHGLAGSDTPLESRILMVADAFEAITSDRPYRPGRPAADALAELEQNAGSQLDVSCVAALRRVLQRGADGGRIAA